MELYNPENVPLGEVVAWVVLFGPHPALLGKQASADTEYTVAVDKTPIQRLRGFVSAFAVQVCFDDPSVAVAFYSTTLCWP